MTNVTYPTPGPWQAHPAAYADNGEWAISTPLRRIALANNQVGNAEANAALIATAPALLGWLRWVRANLVTNANYPDDVTIMGLALDDAIAAELGPAVTPTPKCPKCNMKIGFLFEYEKAEVSYTYTVDREGRPHSDQHDVLAGVLIGYDCPECGERLFDQEADAIHFLAEH